MNVFESTPPLSLLYFSLVLLFVTPSQVTSSDEDKKCQPGYVLFSGECIKKVPLPKPKACPDPDIRFGSFELRAKGRLVYFSCESGWKPAPPVEYALCKLGKWDRELPNCVRPGCEDMKDIAKANDVIGHEDMNGALMRFECMNPSQNLFGSRVVGCDGSHWNATIPFCKAPEVTTATTEKTVTASDRRQLFSSGSSTSSSSLIMVLLLTSSLLASRDSA